MLLLLRQLVTLSITAAYSAELAELTRLAGLHRGDSIHASSRLQTVASKTGGDFR